MRRIKRRHDWRTRLDRFLDGLRHQAFDWRNAECGVAFAGGAVLALTGEDLAAEWRGRYTTARGALRVMRQAGFETPGDVVADLLPEAPVSLLRVGDLAAVPTHDQFGCGLGIVNGERIFVRREDGLGTVDLLTAMRGFKVG